MEKTSNNISTDNVTIHTSKNQLSIPLHFWFNKSTELALPWCWRWVPRNIKKQKYITKKQT